MNGLRSASALLALTIVALAWRLAGLPGTGYLVLYTLLLVPGLPFGFLLFGRRHAAGWIAGALIGYGLSAVALWTPADMGLTARAWIPVAWTVLVTLTLPLLRTGRVLVQLPAWQRGDTIALLCTLLIVPLLVSGPFSRIGERDAQGAERYRAYFTADFLWHVALTSELTKADVPIRNPYLERRALNYYWGYFVPPAMIARLFSAEQSLEAVLLLNALGAGLLFVASIYLYGWCVVPRAGPAAISVALTFLAASAEGLFALFRLARSGLPLDGVRALNIDAMTSWVFQSLTIDSLPRSLWYTPQHAAACALGLVALIVPTAGRSQPSPALGLAAGVPLGLAIVFSPFLGGVFCVLYGLAAAWTVLKARPIHLPLLASYAVAVAPALLGLGWCVANRAFEGAGGVVEFGLSQRAAAAPFATILLAAGPIGVIAALGLAVGRSYADRWPAVVIPPVVALLLFYFVTLSTEPVWIGWRAGQILLVTLPPLAAMLFARLGETRHRWTSAAVAAVALAAGVPTTAIDAWNAQDVDNLALGPGFRWTVAVPSDTQAAMTWIRANTDVEAVVQMSIGPRGRETWTLVPAFGHRRMAAGQPISLLHVAEYDERSGAVDAMFRTHDVAEAARLAREQQIDYVYADSVERAAFDDAAISKFNDPRYFTPVFQQGQAIVFQVR